MSCPKEHLLGESLLGLEGGDRLLGEGGRLSHEGLVPLHIPHDPLQLSLLLLHLYNVLIQLFDALRCPRPGKR